MLVSLAAVTALYPKITTVLGLPSFSDKGQQATISDFGSQANRVLYIPGAYL